MLNTQKPIQLCLCLLALLLTGAAEARWYKVEIVAFAHQRGEYIDSEDWPLRWNTPDTSNAIDFEMVTSKFFSSNRATGSLSSVAKRIDESSRFRLLTYKAWRQAGLSKRSAREVRLRSAETVSGSLPIESGGDTIEVPVLDGTIKVVLGRFLHVYTDLVYTAPVSVSSTIAADGETPVLLRRIVSADTAGAQLQGFTMKAHRKTKSKETQFIDHPLFGLIVYFTPI